jgi:hypothetical protein
MVTGDRKYSISNTCIFPTHTIKMNHGAILSPVAEKFSIIKA